MAEKIGRNDPCPCGSGKKYKQCCFLTKPSSIPGKKKFTAKLISGGGIKKDDPARALMQSESDLMERTFGQSIARAHEEGRPALPSNTETFLKDNEEKR